MENRTKFFKKEEVDKKWYVIDAENKVLGRLATRIAAILQGKNKPEYTPNNDCGDYVIVTNCEKVVLTGKKLDEKKYYRHSGYLGNLKVKTAGEILRKNPEFLIKQAVKGMLPKNKLGKRMLKKLKVYAGPEHPHQAQKPEVIDL
ncbi:MAG: large subunit ribosomal protein [Thermotogaceae bacterium]|nr:large subunit ribosomal protein [Thermotogaceae bacterium]